MQLGLNFFSLIAISFLALVSLSVATWNEKECKQNLVGSVGVAVAAELCRLQASIEQMSGTVDAVDLGAHGKKFFVEIGRK